MTLATFEFKNFVKFKNMEYFIKQHSNFCEGVFKPDPVFKSSHTQKKICPVCDAQTFTRLTSATLEFEGYIMKAKLGVADAQPKDKTPKIRCVGCGGWADAETVNDEDLCVSCRNTGPQMSFIDYDAEHVDPANIATWQQGQAHEVSAGMIDDCDKQYNAKGHSIYTKPSVQHPLYDISNKEVDEMYKAHQTDPNNIGKLRIYEDAHRRNTAMYTRIMQAHADKKKQVMERNIERDNAARDMKTNGGRHECTRKTLLPLVHIMENIERETFKSNIAGLSFLVSGNKPVLHYEQREETKPYALMVTGHRKLTNHDQVKKQLLKFVRSEKEKHPDLIMISGMALGTDTLFAEIAISENIPLHAYKPFPGQSNRWPPAQVHHYVELLKKCANVVTVDKKYSNAAFMKRNTAMVNAANACVAVWDGRKSGTGHAVHAARGRNITVTVIDPTKKAEDAHSLQLFECAISQPPTATNAEIIEVTRSKNHILSPSWETLNQYKKDDNWEKYTESFKREMNTPTCTAAMKAIIEKARDHPVYLACYEVIGNCHRHLLLKWMQAYCSP